MLPPIRPSSNHQGNCMSRRLFSGAFRALVCLCFVQNVPAAPGDLDPSFGVNGVARFKSDVSVSTTILASTKQPDGKLIVVGEAREGDGLSRPAVGRLNVDGSIDTSFGDLGWVVVTNWQATGQDGRAVAVTMAGSKIVVGLEWPFNFWSGLMKLQEDGTPDPEFYVADQESHVARMDFPGIAALSGRADGRTAVAGDQWGQAVLYTVDPYGARDFTFGQGGSTSPGQLGLWRVDALWYGDEGAVIVGGYGDYGVWPNHLDFAIGRFTSTGDPDEGFGDHGHLAVDFGGGDDSVRALGLDPAGRMIAAGRAGRQFAYGDSTPSGFGVVRFDPLTGLLDPTFGSGGKVQVDVIVDGGDLSSQEAIAQSIDFADNGDTVIAGWTAYVASETKRPVIVRLESSGAVSAAFGSGGVIVEESEQSEAFLGVSVAGASILAAGNRASAPTGTDAALRRRYSAVTGTADGDATVSQAFSTVAGLLAQFAVAPDGSIFTAGRAGKRTRVMRFTATGALDTAWANAGMLEFNDGPEGASSSGRALAIDAEGRIVVASLVETPGFGSSAYRWSVKRLNPDGSTDMSFGGGDAAVNDVGTLSFVGVLPDGRVVVAGGKREFAEFDAARLNADGTLDTSFGWTGVLRTYIGWSKVPTAVVVLPDGRIRVVTSDGNFDVSVWGFAADGGYDMDWQGGPIYGWIDALPPHAFEALPDGRFLVGGRCMPNYPDDTRPCVVRLRANGMFEGLLQAPMAGAHITGLTAQVDDRVIAAGDVDLDSPFAMRLNTDGTLDWTYNSTGFVLIDGVVGDGWQSKVAPDATIFMASHSPPTDSADELIFVKLQGTDSTPDPFSFESLTNVSMDTLVSSFTLISGIDSAASVTIENGEYAIDCQHYTDQPGFVAPWHSICIRHRSAPTGNTTVTTRLVVGGVSATFSSTTGTPPDTQITSMPPAIDSQAVTLFAFRSDDSGAGFECRVDGGIPTPCPFRFTVGPLAEGSHQFSVAARNHIGSDPTPATYSWIVDRTPPETTLGQVPAPIANSATATFAFTGTDTLSSPTALTFECQIDGAAFAACAESATFGGLADGAHVFTVRARDQAGNYDPTPSSYAWTIDTVAPDTTIVSTPSGNNNKGLSEFTFGSTEAGVTYECSVDGATYSSCGQTQAFDLAKGNHTLLVRARDLAGNVDASPATWSWRSH